MGTGLAMRYRRMAQRIRTPLRPELAATAHDRVAFAALAGLTLDPWQSEVARSESARITLDCSRQAGKSTVTSVLAMHEALFVPDSLTLMVSKAERQSGELFRKALGLYRKLGKPIPARSESALQLELTNGARVIALPGSEGSIRSYSSVSLLLVDEAARVPDETHASIRPMLAVSGGREVDLSTPFGSRGWWYELWRGEEGRDANGPLYTGDEWARWRVPATECPRISPAFLEEERRTLGWWWYEQEYMCRFLDAKTAAFREADIEAAVQEYEMWELDI